MDPSIAVEAGITRSEGAIAAESVALADARLEIAALAEVFALGRARLGDEPGFEVIKSLPEIRRRLYTACDAAKDSVFSFAHSPNAESYGNARDGDLENLSRGVKMRSIVRTLDLETPGVFDAVRVLHSAGEEVRGHASVPTQMVLVDQQLAVVRIDPDRPYLGAMFIRTENLVRLLAVLFEQLWADGQPLFSPATEAPPDRLGDVLAMVASGLKDEGIARALNVGVRTIRRDVSRLREILGVGTRTEIVAAAIRRGWL